MLLDSNKLMTEQCAFCGHKHLTAKTTRYLHQQGGELLFVDDVPCLECGFCGEQYFDVKVLKQIERDHLEINARRKQPTRFIQVAVEAFGATHTV